MAEPGAAEDADPLSTARAEIEAGSLDRALATLKETLRRQPSNAEVLAHCATTLYRWGRFHEARQYYLRAFERGAHSSDMFCELGWTCVRAGKLDEAETWMRRALAEAADDWRSHYGLGVVLHGAGRAPEAKEHFRQALALRPDEPDTLMMLAGCLHQEQDLAGAEALLREAIAHGAGSVRLHINLGTVLSDQSRLDEALAAFQSAHRRAEEIGEPAEAYPNLGMHLVDAGRETDALSVLERGLHADPAVDGHVAYAMAMLRLGRLREAFTHHEFRWRLSVLGKYRPEFGKPAWTGQDLRGKTILLRVEQGIGDVIQFVRYAPPLKLLGANVLFEMPKRLDGLTAMFQGIDRVIGYGEPLPPFDFYIHLMSLPAVFRTQVDSVPAAVPYLKPPTDRVEQWKERIPVRGARLQVGLAWAGNPDHINDRFRSMHLRDLEPLWSVPGVEFYSLQKGAAAAQLADCAPNQPVVDLDPWIGDYCDTAAAIHQLDLVISVDTSVAHLAGALGKPVWALLSDPGDPRWMKSDHRTPWYPTMRLFRQSARGRWSDVVPRLVAALREAADDRSTLPQVFGVDYVDTAAGAAATFATRPAEARTRFSSICETRHGTLHYVEDDFDLADSIAWYNEYLQLEIDLLASLIRPGDTMIEVAPGVGAHSLALAELVQPVGHLMLFENRQRLKRLLEGNISANRIRHATIMRKPLRETPSDLRQAALSADPSSSTGHPETIDQLQLDRLDLLKINAGIAPLAVLHGASETLWRLRPRVAIAVPDAQSALALAREVRDFGFRCWRAELPLFNPDNFAGRREDIFAGRVVTLLLGTPEEANVTMDLERCTEIG